MGSASERRNRIAARSPNAGFKAPGLEHTAPDLAQAVVAT